MLTLLKTERNYLYMTTRMKMTQDLDNETKLTYKLYEGFHPND